MTTYIALFRGINVGGHNILPMSMLVEILQSLGCEQVKTYIQSGNAVFSHRTDQAKELAEAIGSQIMARHGFTPKVLLLEAWELAEAIGRNPFKTEDGKALHFFFLESIPLQASWDRLVQLKSDSEEFHLHHKIFYLHAPDGIGRSKLAAKLEQILGVPATARNWNTIRTLAAMAASENV